MSGNSSLSSSLMYTKNKRTATASRMPITPQTIHAGKNDPRILNEGAREHPAANSAAANDTPAAAVRFMPRPSGLWRISRQFFYPFIWRHRFTGLSYAASRRSGKLTQPPQSAIACARSHRRCARQQERAGLRPHRSGCALRSCRTAGPPRRTKRPLPIMRRPPSAGEAQSAQWSTPTTPGSPPDRASHRCQRRPASAQPSRGPAAVRVRIRRRVSRLD